MVSVKEKEKILVGDDVKITVVVICGKQIRLGFEALSDVVILRGKLVYSKDDDQ